MKNRIKFLDIAKGIAILAIIAGHTGPDWVKQFVFTFHVPIFFIISGYFLKEGNDVVFVKKKLKQLLTPYVFGCCGIVLGNIIKGMVYKQSIDQLLHIAKTWILASLYGSGTIEYSGLFYARRIGALWFLPALFFAMIIVQYSIKKPYGYLYIIICSYVGYKTTNMFWLPLSIQAGMFASIFVYIGYMAKKQAIFSKDISWATVGGAFSIWIICIFYGGKFYLVRNYCGNGMLDILGGITGSYVIFLACRFVEQHMEKMAVMLTFFGCNSLVALCIHTFDLDVISWESIILFGKQTLRISENGVLYILLACRLIIYSVIIAGANKIALYKRK